MSCTAVLEIVSIGTGDDDIAKLERFDGLRNAMRLIGGGRLGSAVRQVAECAAAGAQFPENQKGGRTVREAFGTVGAGSFAADGGERIRRQNVANWVFGSSGNGSSHLEPGGLGKRGWQSEAASREIFNIFLKLRPVATGILREE